MISANELRIGNYFLGNGKTLWLSEIKHLLHVKEWVYAGWHEETKQRFYINFFDAQPIPLTPEILVKSCGFNTDYICYWSEYSVVDGTVHYVTFGYYKGKIFFHLPTGRIDVPGIEIKYLHQLQNLYFALTGKELKINL